MYCNFAWVIVLHHYNNRFKQSAQEEFMIHNIKLLSAILILNLTNYWIVPQDQESPLYLNYFKAYVGIKKS